MNTTPTLQQIEAARSHKGGYSREALASLGVQWPPPKGWLKKLTRAAKAVETPDDGPQRLFHLLAEGTVRQKASRTIKIIFDGGTPCNVPAKGYGDGYGSYQIDGGKVVSVVFQRPMSANAAEIWTAAFAVQSLLAPDAGIDPSTTALHFWGDSRTALKWCRIKGGLSSTTHGSEEFRNAITALRDTLPKFHSVKADWWPRENSVKIFGH